MHQLMRINRWRRPWLSNCAACRCRINARIVAESLACGQSVSKTARRHGLSTSQLSAWRRQAWEQAGDGAAINPVSKCKFAVTEVADICVL